MFHQPRFPWNNGTSFTKPPFGVRSCEVAIIWPGIKCAECMDDLPIHESWKMSTWTRGKWLGKYSHPMEHLAKKHRIPHVGFNAPKWTVIPSSTCRRRVSLRGQTALSDWISKTNCPTGLVQRWQQVTSSSTPTNLKHVLPHKRLAMWTIFGDTDFQTMILLAVSMLNFQGVNKTPLIFHGLIFLLADEVVKL